MRLLVSRHITSSWACGVTRVFGFRYHSSKSEDLRDDTAQPADYEALLRKLLPYQQDVLQEAIQELRKEREALEAVVKSFDTTLKNIEAVRDEIRELVQVSERHSIERRDELLTALRNGKTV
mmetsp:Transcript_4818/g.5253  ORF Transcript_4818/g.5253 Transcript_4818/m.5253 type:complete len:122 (+) Transcript_4818:79-444(+)